MSSDEGSISEGESETSHDPDHQDEDSTTSNETEAEEEFHEILTSGCAGETEILSKGQRRRILAAAKGISEAATAEAERRSCPEKVPRVRRLRTGYKILEIFTWSCLLSRFAYGLGWEYLEPLTLPGWDLKSPKVEKEAWDYLHRVNPDFIAVAWPCTEWTIMQNANQKTWTQKQVLLARRVEARKLLRFTRRVTLWQARSGRAILGENPLLSLAWKEPDIIDAFGHLDEAICDQCQYGLRHPENGMPIKKPTRFVGQAEVVSELHHRCPGDHQHHQIEGTVKTSAYGRISLSSWAGGYPLPLCRAIMRGVHTFLDKQANDTRTEVYMLDDQVPEEAIQEGEEGIDEEEQRIQSYKDESEDDLEEEERRPISQEVKRAVEFAHRQLGHPSRDTLVRMLRINFRSE